MTEKISFPALMSSHVAGGDTNKDVKLERAKNSNVIAVE